MLFSIGLWLVIKRVNLKDVKEKVPKGYKW